MTIPFIKSQAVGNDFLIVQWENLEKLGLTETDIPALARRICDRHFGAGADGMELVYAEVDGADASLRLFNSDGSEAEISGNGTRCVAAWLLWESGGSGPVRLHTKAGTKELQLLHRAGCRFTFGMNMGRPVWRDDELDCGIETSFGQRTATIVNVGNPQCVLFVDNFEFDWRGLGGELESLPRFPRRTNVSFVKVLDKGVIDVRFWERGAGETLSSGTGSAGAGVGAILTGRCESPLRIATPAGEMKLRWDGDVTIEGDAVIVGRGEYFHE
jgi:diaminopimelate epimerase